MCEKANKPPELLCCDCATILLHLPRSCFPAVTAVSHSQRYAFGMPGLILIVDDEADLVETLEYNLRSEGYRTRSVFTGQEALLAASQKPIPDRVRSV